MPPKKRGRPSNQAAADTPESSAAGASRKQPATRLLAQILLMTSEFTEIDFDKKELQDTLNNIVEYAHELNDYFDFTGEGDDPDSARSTLTGTVQHVLRRAGYVHDPDAELAEWVATGDKQRWMASHKALSALLHEVKLFEQSEDKENEPPPAQRARQEDEQSGDGTSADQPQAERTVDPSIEELLRQAQNAADLAKDDDLKRRADEAFRTGRADGLMGGASGNKWSAFFDLPQPTNTQDSGLQLVNGKFEVVKKKFLTFERWHEFNLDLLIRMPIRTDQDEYRGYIKVIVTLKEHFPIEMVLAFDSEMRSLVQSGEIPGFNAELAHNRFNLVWARRVDEYRSRDHGRDKGKNKKKHTKVCDFFKKPGGCKKGDKCDFKHEK